MTIVTVTPARLDLRFVRGDDASVVLTFKDDSDVVIDMSDSTFAAQFRRIPDDPNEYSFTIDDSQASSGIVVLNVDHDVASGCLNSYYWDIQRIYRSDGVIQTLMGGSIDFVPDVTHL